MKHVWVTTLVCGFMPIIALAQPVPVDEQKARAIVHQALERYQARTQQSAAPSAYAPVATQQGQQVNINTADAQTLASVLKGIGPKKAQAIVEWRKLHGAFRSVSQLAEVKGIGDATVEKNRVLIVLQ